VPEVRRYELISAVREASTIEAPYFCERFTTELRNCPGDIAQDTTANGY
jgi:hypothetical protein